jgi:hypothetical protein
MVCHSSGLALGFAMLFFAALEVCVGGLAATVVLQHPAHVHLPRVGHFGRSATANTPREKALGAGVGLFFD